MWRITLAGTAEAFATVRIVIQVDLSRSVLKKFQHLMLMRNSIVYLWTKIQSSSRIVQARVCDLNESVNSCPTEGQTLPIGRPCSQGLLPTRVRIFVDGKKLVQTVRIYLSECPLLCKKYLVFAEFLLLIWRNEQRWLCTFAEVFYSHSSCSYN